LTIVGNDDFQYILSKLAYSFNGGLTMDYLELQGFNRILELQNHANKLSKELENV